MLCTLFLFTSRDLNVGWLYAQAYACQICFTSSIQDSMFSCSYSATKLWKMIRMILLELYKTKIKYFTADKICHHHLLFFLFESLAETVTKEAKMASSCKLFTNINIKITIIKSFSLVFILENPVE